MSFSFLLNTDFNPFINIVDGCFGFINLGKIHVNLCEKTHQKLEEYGAIQLYILKKRRVREQFPEELILTHVGQLVLKLGLPRNFVYTDRVTTFFKLVFRFRETPNMTNILFSLIAEKYRNARSLVP